MTIKQIQLNPMEATAYWWVKTIKNKVRDIAVDKKNYTVQECEFLKKFYHFTDVEWRNLYLRLTSLVTDRVHLQDDDYKQDTAQAYHNDINAILETMIQDTVPDIRLASRDVEDSVIYTNIHGANQIYYSCEINPLSTCHEANYILTGDSNDLKFHNLVMAVITVLNQNNKNHSVDHLRMVFCNIYEEMYGTVDRKELEEKFNLTMSQISEKGLIIGTPFEEEFSCQFADIDLVGLDQYTDRVVKSKIIKGRKV